MSSDADDVAELESRLRSLERKLRRDKLGLEKLNPLVHADAYVAALEHVADLEAERRELRAALRGSDPEDEDDVSSDDSSEDSSDDASDDPSDDETSDEPSNGAEPAGRGEVPDGGHAVGLSDRT